MGLCGRLVAGGGLNMGQKVLHVYSRDGRTYYGNVMFRFVKSMSEEEYEIWIDRIIKEHFPELRGKQYCMIWKRLNLR